MMGLQFEPGVAGLFGERQQSLAKAPSRVDFAASPAKQPLAPQCRKNIDPFGQTVAKRLRPGIGLQHFRRAEAARRHESGSEGDQQVDFDLRPLASSAMVETRPSARCRWPMASALALRRKALAAAR